MIQKEKFDLVHFSSSILGFYRLPAGIPLLADTHNVEHELMYRTYKEATNILLKLYYAMEYRLLKREEIESSRKFAVVMTTSKRDLETFRKDLPDTRMYVLPNGVDTEFFSPVQTEPEPHSIIFTGLMNYYPNDHGIQFFLNKIFPLILSKVPDTRLFIVGANPSKEVLKYASDRVTVTGRIDDVRPYFHKAEVAIIPLLIGGGTRLKVLEAMAMKKPVVSTSLGSEGLEVHHEHDVLLADTPQDFADAVVKLFTHKQLRRRLVQNAYTTVHNKYDWRIIGAKLEEVFQEFCAKQPQQSHVEHLRPSNSGIVTEYAKDVK